MGKTNSRLKFLTIHMIYRHILKTFHFFYVFNHKNMTGPCIFAVGTGFSPHTFSLLLTPLPGFMIHSAPLQDPPGYCRGAEWSVNLWIAMMTYQCWFLHFLKEKSKIRTLRCWQEGSVLPSVRVCVVREGVVFNVDYIVHCVFSTCVYNALKQIFSLKIM